MLFDFNIYSSLLLIGFIQGLVYAGLLLWRNWRWQRIADRLMALILLLCCLTISSWMLGFAGWYDVHDWHTTVMFYIPFDQLLALGPLIYFYFLAVTNADFRWQPRYMLHFIPAFTLLLLPLSTFLYDIIYQHLLLGLPLPYFYGTKGALLGFIEESNLGIYAIVNPLSLVHFFFYLWLTIRTYRQYRTYLQNHFSDTERRSFRWLRNILLVVVFGMGVATAYKLVGQFMNLSYIDSWYAYFALSLMVYVVAIQSYHATAALPADLHFEPLPPPATADPAGITPDLTEWNKKVALYMEEHQPYLEPDINLQELARRLKTNTSHLSKVINLTFDQNFNDFINSYRCQAFQAKIAQGAHQQLTFLSLALDCGFNSKATFNRAFKKHTGLSPGAYAQQTPSQSTP